MFLKIKLLIKWLKHRQDVLTILNILRCFDNTRYFKTSKRCFQNIFSFTCNFLMVVFGSREDVPTPKKGQDGPLEHSRLELVGWCVAKVLPLVKSGVWGCVQSRAQWSTEEDVHMRPSHDDHWLCEFGDAGNDTSCERQFNLNPRKCEDYRDTRFYNQDSSNNGSTEWRRMCQDSRSKSGHRTLTHHGHLCQ
jgi:hypothetical protein